MARRGAMLRVGAAMLGRRAGRVVVVQLRRLRRRGRPHLLRLLVLLRRVACPRPGEAPRLPMALRLGIHMLRLGRGLRVTAATEEALHALHEAHGLLLRVMLMPLSLDHGGAEGGHSYRKQDGTQHG